VAPLADHHWIFDQAQRRGRIDPLVCHSLVTIADGPSGSSRTGKQPRRHLESMVEMNVGFGWKADIPRSDARTTDSSGRGKIRLLGGGVGARQNDAASASGGTAGHRERAPSLKRSRSCEARKGFAMTRVPALPASEGTSLPLNVRNGSKSRHLADRPFWVGSRRSAQ
jgi:hypothetical protein